MLPFDWKKDCMLCGKSAETDARHPERQVHRVATIPLCEKILECCRKRGDMWALEIQDRLHGCIDLVAAEAVYHDSCFSRFMLNKQLDAATAKNLKADLRTNKWGNILSSSVSGLSWVRIIYSCRITCQDGGIFW